MDLVEEVKTVEKELVDLIIARLKSNSIAVEAARQQAKDFLALLPVKDQKDLLDKLKGLGEKYNEAKMVYAEELGKINEVERQKTLDAMRNHITTGNIDAAIAAAKALYPPKVDEQMGSAPALTPTPAAVSLSPTPSPQVPAVPVAQTVQTKPAEVTAGKGGAA